jgi:hypothetical protein
MIKTNELFKSGKPFPKWMASHKVFKEVDHISKVFPGIGLPNSSGDATIDNAATATKTARHLLDQIKRNLKDRRQSLKDYKDKHPNISADRVAKLNKTLDLITQVKKTIGKGKTAFISNNNGRIVLTMPDDIGGDKPVFKKGERLFGVYNKLNDALVDGKFAPMTKLEAIREFKAFSTDNIPNNRFKIVFSSDGVDGAWDIATMSMRGIHSCQSWEGDYSKCLIGSVIDPFVGIIYLTSDAKTEYGSKMIKRCVVRFVVSEETKKPYLYIDNMYPQYDEGVMASFKKFLSDKVQNKLEVHHANGGNKTYDLIAKSYMPVSGVREILQRPPHNDNYDDDDDLFNGDGIASYQDTAIKNKRSVKYKQSQLYDKNSRKKQKRFVDEFAKSMVDAIKAVDQKRLPNAIQDASKKQRGKKNGIHASHAIEIAGKEIATEIAKSVDRNSFTLSNIYLRRLYYSYFANKKKAVNAVKTKVARSIKGGLGIKTFRSDQLVAMMNAITPEIDAVMKVQLNKLRGNKKAVKPLPLP